MCKLENGKKNQSFMSTDSCNIWNQISKKMMDELMVLSLNGYKSVSEQYIQIIGDFLIGLELWTEDKVII